MPLRSCSHQTLVPRSVAHDGLVSWIIKAMALPLNYLSKFFVFYIVLLPTLFLPIKLFVPSLSHGMASLEYPGAHIRPEGLNVLKCFSYCLRPLPILSFVCQSR